MSDEVCQIEMYYENACGRRAYRDGKCIFHLENKSDEEAEIFNDEFKQELGRMEKDDIIEMLDFTRFIFPTEVNFSRHSFEKYVLFAWAEFNKDADFSRAEFKGRANFLNAEFNGAHFNGAKFNIEADFNGAKFKEPANLRYVASASFQHAEFNMASFGGAEFKSKADFSGAKFKGTAGFFPLVAASFFEAKFKDTADFIYTEFNEVSFSNTEFKGDASFLEAKFNIVYFNGAEFKSNADFTGAKFNDEAKFRETKFKEADFRTVEFLDRVSFRDTKFPTSKKHLINFDSVRFHKQKDVKFQNVNLSNVSFLNTDITGVEFLDEMWGDKEGGRFRVVDEKRIGEDESLTPVTYEAVIQLYRRLRRNYENSYRYAEAGDFFIGEMEMRRLAPPTWLLNKRRFKNKKVKKVILLFKRYFSILSIYNLLSRYGESYTRPALWAFAIIVSYPIINNLVSHWIFNTSLPDYTTEFLNTYPIRDSVASFFQLENTYLGERLIGIPILGSLFIALKRKFERKG